MVQDTLNQALHMIENLLAKCEHGKDSRALAAELGAIMETVEAAHSESVREAQSAKRATALLRIEVERTAKLEQRIDALQRRFDVLTKNDRPPDFVPPFAGQSKLTR